MADTGTLNKQIEDLTSTVNRLSQRFDDYAYHTPSAGGYSTGTQPQKSPAVFTPHQPTTVYNPPSHPDSMKHREAMPPPLDDEADDFTQDFSKDENVERGNWSGRLDFLLSCLGFAVGLGNVWRFPYLCYKNGGAVFFIPYIIMLFFVGMPIFYLELSLGQFSSMGALTCWEFAPIFKGIGVAMCIVSGLVGIYYNMIIAWAIYYFVMSFTKLPGLPWDSCRPGSGWEYCKGNLKPDAVNCTRLGPSFNARADGVCYNNSVVYGLWNSTLANANGFTPKTPSDIYLNREVLGLSTVPGIEAIGYPKWELVVCLAGAWLIVILSLWKGIKSSGKVVYFTALFPYVVLIILLVRGLTLPNYYAGIEFYILKPDLAKLMNAQVWKDAAVQIFFSLSASWGGLITLSSYNRFHNDCLRDALLVSLGNCLTSFFAGFVIFSFLGFLAGDLGVPVDQVADSGVTLAFVVYPDAVTRMPIAPLWAILFFLMIITLGLDSEFAMVETCTTSIMDQWPSTRKKKTLVIILVALVFFVLGLPLTCPGGAYVLQLMDNYAGGWNLLVIALCECIAVGYVYGVCRFKRDITTMLGRTGCGCFPWSCCFPWWATNWCVITPAGVLFILIFSWVDYIPVTYGSYKYPAWADGIGWAMTLVVVAAIFVTAFFQIIRHCRGNLSTLVTPSRYWGPALVKHRRLVTYVKGFEVDPYTGDQAFTDMNMQQMKSGTPNPAYH